MGFIIGAFLALLVLYYAIVLFWAWITLPFLLKHGIDELYRLRREVKRAFYR